MAKRAGVVWVDVEPNLSQVGARIDAEARKLKPFGVKLEVQGDGLKPIGSQIQTMQRQIDTFSTRAVKQELVSLGDTADRELSRVQSNVARIGNAKVVNTGSVFDGTSTLPHGFSTSRQVTAAVPIKVPPIDVSGIEKIETVSTKALPSVSRLGGGLRTLGTNVGSVAAEVAPLTGELGGLTSALGSAAAGGFAAGGAVEVVVSALSTAWTELKRQTAEGVAALTPAAEDIVAAFDPAKPQKFGYEVEGIARKLAQVEAVGPTDAWDTIQGWFGFDDDTEDRANLMRSTLDTLKEALGQLSTDQGRDFLTALTPRLQSYGLSIGEAADLTGELMDELDRRDSIQRATSDVEKFTNRLDKFGFMVDATRGKWAQYGSSLGQAFAPIDAALSAQEALSDGQRTVAEAQQRYQDIVNGNTEGLKSAAEALRSARDDLAKAVSETGPGSKAARDAAKDVRDALRAYRDLQVEIGKGPAEGDFFDPRTQDLEDAYQAILDAQEKVNEIESGNSDAVVSARDRVTDAQERYNDELAKTGPNSKEAADALEAVTDAERELPGLVVNVETAQANLREEILKHPEAIQQSITKIDEWVRKGLISTAVAKAWKEELILAAEASKNIDTSSEFVGDDGTDREHQARRPVTRSSKPSPGAPKEIISISKGEEIGLSDTSFLVWDFDRKQYFSYDEKEREWYLDREAGTWSRYSTGGIVPGFTIGDTHKALLEPGEGVLSKPAMRQLGADNFHALNRGEQVVGAAVADLLTQLVGGQEALRQDLVSLLRSMFQTPDAAVAWLQAIEANTRRPAPGVSVEEVQARAAQFV